MAAGDSKLSTEHVLGNVSVPRYVNPQIRASIRREDPDGNPEPHYTGLNGTTLNIDYSPTGAVALPFTSDNLDDALLLINAADPANLIAIEEDGYLVLKNLNGGEKNYMEIVGGDAAAILGFVVSPEPGSKSYAGELATSPPGRYKAQNNPQGTALIAGDEDLTSSSLNRALARSIVGAARVARDLDILVPAIKEFTGTVVTHVGSGKQVVYVQDASLRIPVNGFGITTTTPAGRELDAVVHILNVNDEPLIDIDQATERYARVLDVYAEAVATGSASLNNAASVAAFGTPDGKSIFGPTVEDLAIQGVTAIGAIRGDLLIANGASFITNGVQPGNTAVIESATNGDPFNHNGEFIVTEVLTEAIIAVRPKSEFEKTFIAAEKPTSLNKNLPGGTNYGTIRVLVGDYFSAKNGVAFEVPSWVPAATSVKVRCVSAARMRDVGLGDFTRAMAPNQGSLLKEFKDHIVDAIAGRRHAAIDVDAAPVAGSPDSLSGATVAAQLAELLNHTNTLIAGQVNYGGGIAWADTAGDTPVGPTTNPATDLESQVDKMLNDLAGAGIDGVAKIRALAAGDLLAGNLRAQLNQIDTEWSKLNRTETVTGAKTFSALTDLDGGATVGTAGITSDGDVEITGATKSFKTNSGADTVPGIISSSSPTDHKLLWEFAINGTEKGRIYASSTGFDGPGIEFTVNAYWDGANWAKDDTASTSSKMNLSGPIFGLWYRAAGVGTWADNIWSQIDSTRLEVLSHLRKGGLDLQGIDSVPTHVLRLGQGLLNTAAEAEIPRISVIRNESGTIKKTLVMQFGNPSIGMWRFYASDTTITEYNEQFELTYNAKWNSGTQQWNRDNDTADSTLWSFDDQYFTSRFHDSAEADTWNYNAWANRPFRLRNDDFGIFDISNGRINFSDVNNPTPTGAITANSLYPSSIIKAWGSCTLGLGGPFGVQGFGLNALDLSGTAPTRKIRVYMDNAFDGGGNYAVAAGGSYVTSDVVTDRNTTWRVHARTTTTFYVQPLRAEDSTWLDPGAASNGGFFTFMAVGNQNT